MVNTAPALPRATGSVLYTFATPKSRSGQILYVNTVGNFACTNYCHFCSREDAMQGKLNIYEKKAGTNLFLPKPPLAEEVISLVKARIGVQKPESIVFVGLGEPLLNFNAVRNSISGIRSLGFSGKIAMDTNGQVMCWITPPRNPAQELREAGLDEIRISVNAINSYDYNRLCRPRETNPFSNICDFLASCLNSRIEVFASFVAGFSKGSVATKNPEAYELFACLLGIKDKNVLIREYVPPIEQH